MAKGTQIKPTHKAVKEYYAALERYAGQNVAHEGAVRSAFQNLLADGGRKCGWTLIPELTIDANGQQIRPDGTFRDEYTIERGYWEAKDTDDDLDTEIKKKIKHGYRLTNTIFEDTREARLYQDGKLALLADLTKPQQLCDLLNTFFAHTEPAHEDFGKAVDEFKQRVPELARGLVGLIERAGAPSRIGGRRPAIGVGDEQEACSAEPRESARPNTFRPCRAAYLSSAGKTGRESDTPYAEPRREGVCVVDGKSVTPTFPRSMIWKHGYLTDWILERR